MLSRTADHLFWMSRYTERAENLARLLDDAWQMSLVPQSDESSRQNWQALIVLNNLQDDYAARYDGVSADQVLRFMITDPLNPSSVYSCLRMARENAHAVRGTITTEMWETLNATWLDMRTRSFESIQGSDMGDFLEWVKMRSSFTRGVTLGTLLQDEAYHFIRLGTLLERADNTARTLDVKFVAAAEGSASDPHGGSGGTGGVTGYYRWAALLRSVSALEVYRKVYRDTITPARVAELLILRPDMPRSLRYCVNGVLRNLERVRNSQSAETERQAGLLHARLHYGRVEDILEHGLHEWLSDFLDGIYALGNGISKDFLVLGAEVG
ncbi:alpha-E domain-containing protein [Amphibiibacter pelophylacis]|uniref:Alpha-E domain-containing protein n=1 Tax=Amphibiibacter pelophylacis TaxID=1799477 RepID=A0ACC6P1G1_9BURK